MYKSILIGLSLLFVSSSAMAYDWFFGFRPHRYRAYSYYVETAPQAVVAGQPVYQAPVYQPVYQPVVVTRPFVIYRSIVVPQPVIVPQPVVVQQSTTEAPATTEYVYPGVLLGPVYEYDDDD